MTEQPGNGLKVGWGDKALSVTGGNTMVVLMLIANLAGLVYGFRELRKEIHAQFLEAQMERTRFSTEVGSQYRAAVVRFSMLEETLTRQNQIANCIGRLSEADMRTLREQLHDARRGDTSAVLMAWCGWALPVPPATAPKGQ